MENTPLSPEQEDQLRKVMTQALKDKDLWKHHKKIWVYQETCLVVDFNYKWIGFGFNLRPVADGLFNLELVQRGKLSPRFSVVKIGERSETIAKNLTQDKIVETVCKKTIALLPLIDAFIADPDKATAPKDPELSSIDAAGDAALRAWKTTDRKKVGVMTLPLGKNYGGNLQAYALMQSLRGLNCQPVLINRRYAVENSGPAPDHLPLIYDRIAAATAAPTHRFIEQHILPITRPYYSSAQLAKQVDHYDLDAVVVGSDQVWRPKYARGLLMDLFHSYLGDRKDGPKRISYAASFGADTWEYNDDLAKKASKLLGRFDAVSVREDQAADMCEQHFGVPAQHVLDPTLLLDADHYKQLIGQKGDATGQRRVTSYVLNQSPEKQQMIAAVAKKLSATTLPCGKLLDTDGQIINDSTVEGWLAAFYQSDFVFTDSFHGVAFSILFNKPFIAFGNPDRGMARFTSILKMVGLEDRLVVEGTTDIKRFLKPIDWKSMNTKLKTQRRKSLKFLQAALGITDTKPKTAAPEMMAVAKSGNPLGVLCTGCGVCASESEGRLKMDWTKEGFLEPKTRSKKIPKDALRVCPFNPAPDAAVATEDLLGRNFFPDAPQHHPRGGHFENTYVGYSTEFRETSSSGGIATFVFDQLLRRNHVDHLFIVKGDQDGGYRYQIFDKGEDIKTASKTRYFPVTLEELFTVMETHDGKIGISGVSCFVKAIRLKQHYHPALREKIPFITGIICGGLKSRFYTDFLAQTAGIKGPYQNPEYRVKNPKAQANDYAFSAQDADGKPHNIRMRPLGDMWGSGLFKTKACDFCTDVLTELADISLGDAWLPAYNADGMGNSVITTRSKLADQIIQDGLSSGDLVAKTVPMDSILRSQSGGINHKLNTVKFRNWASEKYTSVPIPFYRTRLEKQVSVADMLVQILRERVRSDSLRLWPTSGGLGPYNKRMQSSRNLLKRMTEYRKKHPQQVYEALRATLDKDTADAAKIKDVAGMEVMSRWVRRKQFTKELAQEDIDHFIKTT